MLSISFPAVSLDWEEEEPTVGAQPVFVEHVVMHLFASESTNCSPPSPWFCGLGPAHKWVSFGSQNVFNI